MAGQLSARSDFTETLAIHVALKTALKSKQYDKNAPAKKAAEKLCKELESERSIYGRQLKMIRLMEKGVTISELGRKLRCSRRTAFRYLNHLEDANVDITLHNGKYRVDRNMVKMLRA
ncbi:MAG: HTH domain-containing protein [Phycisphaerales bacterium]|nr:MAG: HTH domain-containing protein [Phycisphaerales bacterium]